MTSTPTDHALRAATALRLVSQRPEVALEADHLRELADDLATGEPARQARWSEVDLHSAFPAEDLIAAPTHPHQRWLDWLGHVNTVLLVLPLLVTWIGLRSASAGYASLVADDPGAAAQPFFALWQSGFGGASESFGAVVAWMLLCLLLLVGGQLGARVLGERIAVQAAARAEDARRHLSRALRLASCALSQARQDAPARVAAELLESAATLRQSTEEARKVLASLQRSSSKAQRLIDAHLAALDRTPTTIGDATAALQAAASALDAGSTQIGGAVREVAGQLAAIDAGHRDVGATLTRALTAHDDAAAARLASASAEASAAHRELVAAFGLVLRQVTDELARDADQSAARFSAAHAQLGGAVDKLTTALSDAHRVHETGAAATQSQISALEEMIDRAQLLSDQIAGLRLEAA